MTLFAIFAVMTGIAVLIALAPLRRVPGKAASDNIGDEDVYRRQLDAIERDEASGVVSAAEAEAARAEIARRVVAARKLSATPQRESAATGWTAVVLALAVPAVALPVYLAIGEPRMPGQPAAEVQARQAGGQSDVAELVAKVESHLAEDPEDGQGWRVVAPVYLRMGRYDAAVDAYRNAIRILGEEPQLLADLGEAISASAGGVVTEDARRVLQRALELRPNAVKPQFLLAIAAEQDGDWQAAADAWRGLLQAAPAEAPWRSDVEARLASASQQLGGKGPTEEQVAAAQDMTADQQSAMIEGMVSRLAERLAENGDDLDGWLQLARAYVVLGRVDDARSAIESAEKNFPAEAERIAEASRRLGIGS